MSISPVSEYLIHPPPTWWADIHPVALHQIKDTGQEASVAFIPLAHKQPPSVCLRRCRRKHARHLVGSTSRLYVNFWLEGLSAIVNALDVLTNQIVLHAPGHHLGFHLSIVLS
jgi:hypothetical protein